MHTELTDMFDIRQPIINGPMAFVAGGRLAAAVSNAGGLGMVGGGYGDETLLNRELPLAAKATDRPWGAGLITWKATLAAVRLILSYHPAALMLSFGDPRPFAPEVRGAGCKLICQVQNLDGARLAAEAGADIIIAQGTEAGGHGASLNGTLPFVPVVIDAVAPIPVLAAGGIADGRGLAAVLMLGAAGAVVGTRLCATHESLLDEAGQRCLVAGHGENTLRTSVFDIVRDYDWPGPHTNRPLDARTWPQPYTGRALANQFTDRWHGHEQALRADLDRQRRAYREALDVSDHDTVFVWASQAVDLVKRIQSAADVVTEMCDQAETQLSRAGSILKLK